ncbi:MAG: hypothetical protein OQK12_10085 [Motiliproteus sp.]|nr:hypothetical protein [Motiliproteus sp.]MCW9053875.1 hypothetical protein [Motiliproteus sp.]
MSKVTQFRHFKSAFQPQVFEHKVVQKGEESWWVFRSEVVLNGQTMPYGRVVFFAHSEQEALDWVANQEAGSDESLALTA